jgi:hypothetical protein
LHGVFHKLRLKKMIQFTLITILLITVLLSTTPVSSPSLPDDSGGGPVTFDWRTSFIHDKAATVTQHISNFNLLAYDQGSYCTTLEHSKIDNASHTYF